MIKGGGSWRLQNKEMRGGGEKECLLGKGEYTRSKDKKRGFVRKVRVKTKRRNNGGEKRDGKGVAEHRGKVRNGVLRGYP